MASRERHVPPGNGNLVIARKAGEQIIIDNGRIIIHLIEIRGDVARLAVSAPRDMPVHRKEIQDRIDDGSLHFQQD